MTTDLCRFAAFLGALQQPGRAIPTNAIEALLWIASGVDHVTDLGERMGASAAAVGRNVALLRGRARYRAGTWVESPYGLVATRKHPDRKGYQLTLTPEGIELVRMYFGTDALPRIALTAPLTATTP